MIRCQLFHVLHHAGGVGTRLSTLVEGDALQIGRAAACPIHLPDHRVALQHATISRDDAGQLYIDAGPEALLEIDGFLERRATLASGMRITVGPYQLTVESLGGNADLSLLVKRQTEVEVATPELMALPSISKRRLGLGLALLIVAGWFLLPLLARVSPAFESWQARLPVPMTQMLNPGELAAGHRTFGMQCSSCHTAAFEGVSDAACTECHAEVAQHLPADHSHHARLDQNRCADCHPAHAGKREATRLSMVQCVGCHAGLNTGVGKVRDFATDHPSFHLDVAQGRITRRIRMGEGEALPEQPGLRFSHEVHLYKEGVSSPDGRTVMACTYCHRLGPGGEHFEKMTMEQTCQQSRCHTIRYADPVNGKVPHGSVREVMTHLRHRYAHLIADTPDDYRQACTEVSKRLDSQQRLLDCADRLALKQASTTLFKLDGSDLECALCHEIRPTGQTELPWKVNSLNINRDWQPRASFNHARHGSMACAECHDKRTSTLSSDHSFPDIEKCRKCHAGSSGGFTKLPSACESCHRFHRASPTTLTP